MPKSTRPLLSLLLAAALALACSKPITGPLGPGDFRVGEARTDMSVQEIRAELGEPPRVERSENPYSPGSEIVTWHYEDLDVTLVDGESVLGFTLTGPGVATPRRLLVGDSAARVRELYGEPASSLDGVWDYVDPNDASGLHVLRIEMEQDKVASIFMGHLLD